MKILHIISSAAAGGAEVYARDLSIEMAKRGHDIFIVFLDRASEAGRDLSFENAFLKQLQKNNIKYGFIGQKARRNPIIGIFSLRHFVKSFNPDVVHSHLYYGAVFSLFLNGVKRVYTHHNIRLRANKSIYKLLDLRIDAYIGICDACKRLLEDVTKVPVHHIDNGVDESRIIKKSQYIENNPVKLLFIGRLSDQKNIGLLLEAASYVRGSDFLLMIAGEGALLPELKALSEKLGIASKVRFLGNVIDVKTLLNESDVFVMSSAWEGLPIAQIEATLAGLPVLVTNVGGCSEIVNNVGNGVVVNVDIGEYSVALEELVNDYSIRLKFHNNAIKNSWIYSITTSVDKHLSVYDSL
ncbi:glycosyl transferase family 1 [Halovibrio variabilis]|uniref:Glycosyl transferase family 1 n=1 Tax=Halovibrio variabilis TaxID=31910 RepID=A0A511UUH2_9GAMM|nr:glycosyltransferase [Halovibrio variabilis]GEN29591.1 glycosyl transferase family 1 [Halovibrio variabilis]